MNFPTKKAILTQAAPAAIGPYQQAVAAGGMLYLSGQIGLDPKTMEFAGETVEEQMVQVMKNLEAVLMAGGSSWEGVVKITLFLAHMEDFPKVNAIYQRYFSPQNAPARETVAVKELPKGALVEISGIAFIKLD